MNRTGRPGTILLIVLTIIGAAGAYLFLREEQRSAAERQAQVSKLSEQLQPINEERKKWQEEEKQWWKTLEESKKGRSCVMLSFDNRTEEMYETIYEMMDQYGFRGTLLLRNGVLPSGGEGYLSYGEFQEMMDNDWEYALSVGEIQAAADTEDDALEWQGIEAMSETEEPQEEETEPKNWLQVLDESIASVQAGQIAVPQTVFCTEEQFAEASERDFSGKGFQMVQVVHTTEFPAIGEKGEHVWVLDGGLYTQKHQDLEGQLEKAIQNKQSMAITVNDVQKISTDADYDLSITKFSSLLNFLKEKEEQGQVYVMTYSEFWQYQEQIEQNYELLSSQYAAFRREMQAGIESLDQQEALIVEQSRSEMPKQEGILEMFGLKKKDQMTEQAVSETQGEETETQSAAERQEAA